MIVRLVLLFLFLVPYGYTIQAVTNGIKSEYQKNPNQASKSGQQRVFCLEEEDDIDDVLFFFPAQSLTVISESRYCPISNDRFVQIPRQLLFNSPPIIILVQNFRI